MDHFVIQVLGAVESLVEHMLREEPEDTQKSELVAVTVPQSVPMPRSILANTEPYMHGDWRKEPYLPRLFSAWWQSGQQCGQAVEPACLRAPADLSGCRSVPIVWLPAHNSMPLAGPMCI